jgi:hypothetical protein
MNPIGLYRDCFTFTFTDDPEELICPENLVTRNQCCITSNSIEDHTPLNTLLPTGRYLRNADGAGWFLPWKAARGGDYDICHYMYCMYKAEIIV